MHSWCAGWSLGRFWGPFTSMTYMIVFTTFNTSPTRAAGTLVRAAACDYAVATWTLVTIGVFTGFARMEGWSLSWSASWFSCWGSEETTHPLLVSVPPIATNHMDISTIIFATIKTFAILSSLEKLGLRVILELLVSVIGMAVPHVNSTIMTALIKTSAMWATNKLRGYIVGPYLVIVAGIAARHVDIATIMLLVAIHTFASARELDQTRTSRPFSSQLDFGNRRH